MQHAQASALTALAGTTKTEVGTITTPLAARKILGVWGYLHCPGMTTLESASGILELESEDTELQPFQVPLEVVNTLTSGSVSYIPRVLAVNIPLKGQSRVKGSMTLDMALTVAEKGRFGIITE